MANVIATLIATICISSFSSLVTGEPCVETYQGRLTGIVMESRKQKEFAGFLGVPYAEPPVGKLRFRSPILKKPYNDNLIANKYGHQCTQFDVNGNEGGSEDCLYLNVYTPWLIPNRKISRSKLLPVMVYIHGGGFSRGNGSNSITGPEYLLDRDVILVTLNYRLGIFGFLSTGDLAAPGNFGLKDQVVALQWIQQNIKVFGGDPKQVTIFGESAGSVSINFHALVETSKGLFQKYIMQSGSALAPWAVRHEKSYFNNAIKVALNYRCPTFNSYLMIDCLRKLSTKQLLHTTFLWDDIATTLLIQWGPTIEPKWTGAFLSDSPARLILENKLEDLPFITGVVKDEGLYATWRLYNDASLYNIFSRDIRYTIKRIIRYYGIVNSVDVDDFVTSIERFYMGPKPLSDKDTILKHLTDILTDAYFFYPVLQTIQNTHHKSPFYYYSFDYRGTISRSSTSKNNSDIGVAHTDDLYYLFPVKASDVRLPDSVKMSKKDYGMVDIMVDLWTSFASTGVPETNHTMDDVHWLPYSTNRSYVVIGHNNELTVDLRNTFYENRMRFWYHYAPEYPFEVEQTR